MIPRAPTRRYDARHPSARPNPLAGDAPVALSGLANLGRTTVERLEAVGIADRPTLERVGPAAAYNALCARAGARLPVCYYLYALEGALRGVDWRSLRPDEKARLRADAGVR